MSVLLEGYVPVVQEQGLNTNKNVVFGGTLAVTGASTLTGNVGMSGTLIVTGATTLSSTLAVTSTSAFTGAITTTGGITPVGAPQSVFTVGGSVVTAASGNDTACAANTVTWSSIYIPVNMTITGLGFLIGSVGGTNKAVLSIYDSTGALLGNTTVAGGGTLVGTAANWQPIDLTAPLAVTGGKTYYVATNFDGATAKYRTYPGPLLKFVTGTAAQTLGTPAAITPGTTFNANVGPIMFVY